MPVEILENAKSLELTQVFDRLNRNVRKLNRQELRHARHDGPFIQTVERLVKDPLWAKIKVSTPARIKNMHDVAFVSEILVLTINGIQGSEDNIIDEYYARYDDPESQEDIDPYLDKYEDCMSIVNKLGIDFLSRTRFRNRSDFYSLWATLLSYAETSDAIDYENTKKELETFSKLVASPEDIPPDNEDARRYSDAVRQGTGRKENRQTRSKILKQFIKTK